MKVLSSLFCWLPKVADFSSWFLHLLPFSKKKESSLFLCTDSWCCYNKNRVKSKPSKEVTDLYQQQQEKIGIKTIYKCHGREKSNTINFTLIQTCIYFCIPNLVAVIGTTAALDNFAFFAFDSVWWASIYFKRYLYAYTYVVPPPFL